MGWVTIRGRRYYRLRGREAGRVVTRHFRPGPDADLAAALTAVFRRSRPAVPAAVRRLAALARLARDTDRLLAGLFAPLAASSGLHLHRRQYRRIRGFQMTTHRPSDPPAAAAAITLIDVGDRRPHLDVGALPEADRRALAAAARGDPAGLERARELLADPALADRWGNAVHVNRVKLIAQVAGDNPLALTACGRSTDRLMENFGWARSSLAEKLVITRVVHNWLAIQALEARAIELEADSPGRAVVERCLTQAERRLSASVRTLAVLRGVRPAEVSARLGAAAPPPGAGPAGRPEAGAEERSGAIRASA